MAPCVRPHVVHRGVPGAWVACVVKAGHRGWTAYRIWGIGAHAGTWGGWRACWARRHYSRSHAVTQATGRLHEPRCPGFSRGCWRGDGYAVCAPRPRPPGRSAADSGQATPAGRFGL